LYATYTDWDLSGAFEFAIQSARFRAEFDATGNTYGPDIELAIAELPPQ
jgi:hypothetical protein